MSHALPIDDAPDMMSNAFWTPFWPDAYDRHDLVLDGVCLRRGMRTIITGLSVHVPAASALHIAGANGAGKTTLLRYLAGLMSAVDGASIYGDGPVLAIDMHLLGHRDGLKSRLSVFENMAAISDIMGGRRHHRRHNPALGSSAIWRAMQTMGLHAQADRLVGELSAGQRRRAALLRLILVPRPIWLLDEPLTALDQSARTLLQIMVTQHCRRGGIVIATSHEPVDFADQRYHLEAAAPDGSASLTASEGA